MSRLYITLLGSVALLISSVGALFSIFGLTHLFAGAPYGVGIMAGSLEVAKIIVAGFLYRYWGHIPRLMRVYLTTAVIVLSCITSLGVFGYLTHAYQKSSITAKTQQTRILQLRSQNADIAQQISGIEKFISEIPRNRISKKFEIYEHSRAQIRSLNQKSEALTHEIRDLEIGLLNTETEVGPLYDVSEMTGLKTDMIARALILVFVSVFDPLAICLVFAWGLAVRLREKYRENEVRISALALSKPVDHRFKKSA